MDQTATSASVSTPKQNSNHTTSSESREIGGTEVDNGLPVAQACLTDHSATLPGATNHKRSRLNWQNLLKLWRCVQAWPKRTWQWRPRSRKGKTAGIVKSKPSLTSTEANDSDTTTNESSKPTTIVTPAKDQVNDSFSNHDSPIESSTSMAEFYSAHSRLGDGGTIAALHDETRMQCSHGHATQESAETTQPIPSVKHLGPDPLPPGQKPADRFKSVWFHTQGEVAAKTPKIMRRMFLDGGADANLMVQSVQEAIGAELTPCTRRITWGEDHYVIKHIGEVKVNWYFANKGATYTTTFVVIPGPSWFDTLVGDETITEHKFFIENHRVLAVRGECDHGVGFDDE